MAEIGRCEVSEGRGGAVHDSGLVDGRTRQPVPDFPCELLRLGNELHALAYTDADVSQLRTELEQARAVEERLRANHLLLERAKRIEECRGRYLELVALDRPAEALAEGIAELALTQAPDLGFAILLNAAGELRYAYSSGLPERLAGSLGGTALGSLASVREAVAAKGPVAGTNLAGDGEVGALLVAHDFRSLYSIPALNASGRLLGALCAFGRDAREPDAELKQTLEQTARLLAMGVNQRILTERLTLQAHRDPLTSLPNRTCFYEALHHSLGRTGSERKTFAVLWTDLDRFKQINDTLGHHSADLLLQMAAQRLRVSVGDRGMVARMGGDEFVVLAREIEGLAQAEQLAARIVEGFREPFGAGENYCSLGISIGISLYPDHGEDAEELVRNADLAMYAAKRAGRNTFVCFARESASQTMESVRIEFHLRRALELGELELYFQPLVSCKDGSIAAFETLLRWFCPALGAVSPAQFIPVAEASGLMQEIGKWVLEQACVQAARWQTQAPGVRVAVNVAASQLARGDFHQVVKAALANSGLSPSLLELELTESAVMDGAHCQHWIAELRALGVSLAIDDFGTGYSSLSYLHTLQVDTLKVDRSFVSAFGKEPASARLAETIVGMAKSLGLQVVAEGIETREQMEWLTDLKCDLLQGYYLHRPMPVQGISALLERQPSPAASLDGKRNQMLL